jgi:hypothetical protein
MNRRERSGITADFLRMMRILRSVRREDAMDESVTVPATESARNFGRYQDRALAGEV